MAIIRTPRPDHYTVINNAVFTDENPLSWEAIGLLCYLLSKPDNWTVSPASLANTQRCGINKIHSLLKVLRESCFVIGKKNVNGTFDYLVYDSKQPVDQVKPPHQAKPNQAKPNQDSSRQVNTDIKQILKEKVITEKATAKLEIENEALKNKIAELEKKAVAAKSENETSLPEFKKQTSDEIKQGQDWLNRFVNPEPLPTSPNDIVLTPEQLACYQWAMTDLTFWRGKINSKAKFISFYESQDSAIKHQYETELLKQAQKSPVIATNNTQGLQNTTSNSGINYATVNQQSQQSRKLSLAERAAEATRRGDAFDERLESGIRAGLSYEDALNRARNTPQQQDYRVIN
jgi:hypothetical protein